MDGIFERIEPFFAKRWLRVQLALEAPARGQVGRVGDFWVQLGNIRLCLGGICGYDYVYFWVCLGIFWVLLRGLVHFRWRCGVVLRRLGFRLKFPTERKPH